MSCVAKVQPLCRYCGIKIRKVTRKVFVRDGDISLKDDEYTRYLRVDKLPETPEDCRKLTNGQVMNVKRSESNPNVISYFHEWDGETYTDKFFCTGDHAKLFGYVAAHGGGSMPAWKQAVEQRGGKI